MSVIPNKTIWTPEVESLTIWTFVESSTVVFVNQICTTLRIHIRAFIIWSYWLWVIWAIYILLPITVQNCLIPISTFRTEEMVRFTMSALIESLAIFRIWKVHVSRCWYIWTFYCRSWLRCWSETTINLIKWFTWLSLYTVKLIMGTCNVSWSSIFTSEVTLAISKIWKINRTSWRWWAIYIIEARL